MRKINATSRGLITGAAMIAVSLLIYQFKGNFDNPMQYLVYAMYVGGIYWTLKNFSNRSSQKKDFKNFFSEGFRCFIVVTLLMVAFTWIFIKFNPELENQMAASFRNELVEKGDATGPEIDSQIARAREYFVPMLISMAIFGYLIIGALFTTVLSFVLSRKHVGAQAS